MSLKPIAILLVFIFSGAQAQQGQRGQQQGGQRPQGELQQVSITGRVQDDSDGTYLVGAHVTLMHFRDTTRIYHTSTDLDGRFAFNTLPGRYNLGISYVGYQSYVLPEPLTATAAVNNVGTLRIIPGATLSEVQIVGERPAVLVRGDTLDFDARAVRLNPDANAEDLIRRMAGITVEQSGQVTAQGEQVRRVYVDGREFFGTDPSIALRNLPAEVIERIEVFDEMSEQAQLTGFDDGQRTKTINIVTRLDTRSGQFGRIYAGGGADDRYQSGIATNIMKNDARISILGMSNNVNEQNFSRDDIMGLVAGAIRGGRGGGGGMSGGMPSGGFTGGGPGGDFRLSNNNGDNTTHALGLNYSDNWFENKVRFSASYFINLSDNMTTQITDRQYFLDGTTAQFYTEDSESTSRTTNHRFNLRLNYDIDDKNSLVFTPRLTLQNNNSDSFLNAINSVAGNIMLSQSETGYDSDLTGYNYSGSLVYRRRFERQGRSVSANFSANFNNNQSLYYLDALNEYFSGEGEPSNPDVVSDYLNQRSDSKTLNNTLSANLTYTEPLGENAMLQARYNISRSVNETDRLTYSWDDLLKEYSIFENDYSNRLQSDYTTHRGSLGYRYRKNDLNFTMEMGYQQAILASDREYPYSYRLERTFTNFVPSAELQYNIRRGTSLRFNYRTSTNAPSVTQLQDVINNSNPMLLSSGNPDLEHSYSHFFMGRYNTSNTEKLTNFFLFVMGNFSNGYIGNSTIIAQRDTILASGLELRRGMQFSQPVNMDGFSSFRTSLSYGFPFRLIKSNINLTGNIAYTRTPSMINAQTNLASTLLSGGGLSVSSNISRNIDFTLSYNANYTMVENSIRPALDNNYFTQSTGLRTSFIFAKNWVWRSDASHIMYRGLGDDFNQDYILWNMNVGRKFLKNNLGELTLSVFDLLKQNDNVFRNVSGTYVEDLRTNALTRFFMLTFTYNLRNFNVRPV